MAKKEKPSAREKWQAMMVDRQVEREKDYITLDTGSILYKHAIYKILPVLERADDEARFDFCMHVGAGDSLETEGGKQLKKELYYTSDNQGFSRSIKGIVDACMEVTSDNHIVFNSAAITEKMDPDEVAMMRDPNETRYNLDAWRERRARLSAQEARADRAAKDARNPSLPPKREP